MRNDYGASSLELLESEEYDKYRKNSFSENTYTKTNSVPKTTALPSYKIPQKKVYTYSPPIPKVEKVETNVSKTPDVSSVELLESGNYSQKEIFGGEQKNSFNINERDNRVRKTYAESQVKSSPEISSLEYTEDYLPKQIKLSFESLIDNEKDEHIRKRLLPVLQTFDAAKYSPDFATKLEERYRTNEAYKKWIDESENILEDYARNHPDIDFSAAIDRIQMINGTWILHELIKMGEEEKLTKSGESSKVEEESKKEKILDTASNVLATASLIPGLDTFTNLASIPVDIARGDWVSAGLDAVGMIPLVGEIADAAKTVRLANKAVGALKIADKAADTVKVANTTIDTAKTIDNMVDAVKIAEIADKSTDTLKTTKNVTKITDEAINQVPKVNIQGFEEEQNIFIQNQHKELLKYAKDSNDSKEVAFVFRKGLKDRTVFTGTDDVIDFGNGLIGKGDELIIMHNHPRNSSFSKTDLDEFINNNDIKTLSIAKNNGAVEIITKGQNYTKKEAFLYKERYKRKFAPNRSNAEYNKMVHKFLSYCDKEDIIKWIK